MPNNLVSPAFNCDGGPAAIAITPGKVFRSHTPTQERPNVGMVGGITAADPPLFVTETEMVTCAIKGRMHVNFPAATEGIVKLGEGILGPPGGIPLGPLG
jgi:hypothetical protein